MRHALYLCFLFLSLTGYAENIPKIDLGFRLQSAMVYKTLENDQNNKKNTYNDFYLRRLRLEVGSKFKKDFEFYMDIRNDGVGQDDDGDGEFTIGDAYLKYKLNKNHSLKFHRAKVDVSRTQTASSARLLFHDRPKVTDFAADFVSDGRRASNIQLNGKLGKKFGYHVVIGKGVQSDGFIDAKEQSANEIIKQDFMAGAKIKYSPLTGWEEGKVKETYFGQGQHFTVGLGYFQTNNISYETDNTTEELDRALLNIELSMHYKKLAFTAEYFEFDGVIEDFSVANLNNGSANGYYLQSEIFINNINTHSLILRYESFNHFKFDDDYNFNSAVIGSSYYLNQNKFKLGLFVESNHYGQELAGLINDQRDEFAIKLTSQLHY